MLYESGQPALLDQRLATELYNYYLLLVPEKDSEGNEIERHIFAQNRNEILVRSNDSSLTTVVYFEPRFVDAVELGLRAKLENNVCKRDSFGARGGSTIRIDGSVGIALQNFPFGRTLETWKEIMDLDADRERKIQSARKRFNLSKGQFRRYRYEGYSQDYSFITSADDDLVMYIGYHRMIPVNEARGIVKKILADKPMCLQLEVLMRGY